MPRLSSRLLAVVCAGEWPHNLGFCLDDTSHADVAMNIDGVSTNHGAGAPAQRLRGLSPGLCQEHGWLIRGGQAAPSSDG